MENKEGKSSYSLDTIYRRSSSGRYVPFGVCDSGRLLSDGLWMIRHTDHCVSSTNVTTVPSAIKVSDSYRDKITIDDVCSIEEYVSYIMESKEFRSTLDSPHSISDLVHVCVAKALERTAELKQKKEEE